MHDLVDRRPVQLYSIIVRVGDVRERVEVASAPGRLERHLAARALEGLVPLAGVLLFPLHAVVDAEGGCAV